MSCRTSSVESERRDFEFSGVNLLAIVHRATAMRPAFTTTRQRELLGASSVLSALRDEVQPLREVLQAALLIPCKIGWSRVRVQQLHGAVLVQPPHLGVWDTERGASHLVCSAVISRLPAGASHLDHTHRRTAGSSRPASAPGGIRNNPPFTRWHAQHQRHIFLPRVWCDCDETLRLRQPRHGFPLSPRGPRLHRTPCQS